MSNNFFFFENLAIYEIMWKNSVQPEEPQIKIRCMGSTYWITKATVTQSEYVIRIAFLLQKWLHELASMLRFIACLVGYKTTQTLICNISDTKELKISSHQMSQFSVSCRIK